jgi:hypothetical protein
VEHVLNALARLNAAPTPESAATALQVTKHLKELDWRPDTVRPRHAGCTRLRLGQRDFWGQRNQRVAPSIARSWPYHQSQWDIAVGASASFPGEGIWNLTAGSAPNGTGGFMNAVFNL